MDLTLSHSRVRSSPLLMPHPTHLSRTVIILATVLLSIALSLCFVVYRRRRARLGHPHTSPTSELPIRPRLGESVPSYYNQGLPAYTPASGAGSCGDLEVESETREVASLQPPPYVHLRDRAL